jgi:hypothetical protein
VNRLVETISVGHTVLNYADTIDIILNVQATEVQSVTVNSVALDGGRITRNGKKLSLNLAGLGLPDRITIEASGNRPDVVLLRGTLPPGLTISSGGRLQGMTGNMSGTEQITFRFTLRAKVAAEIRDRAFFINATPLDSPSTWVPGTFPDSVFDPLLGVSYRPLGTLDRAVGFSSSFSGTDPDGEPLAIEVLSNGLGTSIVNDGLPRGIVLKGTTLQGVIHPDNAPGRYVFRLGFVGQTADREYCEIRVSPVLSSLVTQPSSIDWVTPEGFLGELREGMASDLRVEATNTLPVQYSLSPSSLPLPAGLSLSANGQIRGTTKHVPRDTAYPFRVRAFSGDVYQEREFEIRVKNIYSGDDVMDIRFRASNAQATAWTSQYNGLIPENDVYRIGDINFGIQRTPTIYLIKGLSVSSLDVATSGNGVNGVVDNDYHGEVKLTLGRHVVAVCRDANQRVKYEVVYREILDPLKNAGGFRPGDTVVEDRVAWPQSKPGQTKFIFPRSLRNIRYDMVKDIGFSTASSSLRYVTGPNGVEGLPEWMRSRQIANDPNSVMGYTPAMVVCFVAPGKGAALAESLNAAQGLYPVGYVLKFVRYVIFEQEIINETMFDGGETTFDAGGFGIISFDADQ